MKNKFRPHVVNGGKVNERNGSNYKLLLPIIEKKGYALAQIDDYTHLPRRNFSNQPPLTFALEAKLSDQYMPGTWGFGLWNDPFGMGFGPGGVSRLLPVLPNAAWFFFGSEENRLTLRNDQPGEGFHVKTFRSPLLPSFTSLFALPLAPLLLWPTTARILRRLGRIFVKEDGMKLGVDVVMWHTYRITWEKSKVAFFVDKSLIFSTSTVPKGRLGIVIWIDNQYFHFDKSGKLQFGFLKNREKQFLEIRNFRVKEKIEALVKIQTSVD